MIQVFITTKPALALALIQVHMGMLLHTTTKPALVLIQVHMGMLMRRTTTKPTLVLIQAHTRITKPTPPPFLPNNTTITTPHSRLWVRCTRRRRHKATPVLRISATRLLLPRTITMPIKVKVATDTVVKVKVVATDMIVVFRHRLQLTVIHSSITTLIQDDSQRLHQLLV
jgi:hypothetical protein